MIEMSYDTVRISDSINDWQIFQQEDGRADITVSGTIERADIPSNLRVYARVISEDTLLPLVDWTQARFEGRAYSAVLRDVPAGGLYTVQTTASQNPVCLEDCRGECRKHLGVGDIFAIAGQSNATGYGRSPAFDAPDARVHLFGNSDRWDMAAHPMGDSTRSAHLINADYGSTGHSPWLSFAKTLLRALNYPIGLVQTSRGGCPIEMWNPEDTDENLYDNMLSSIRKAGGKIRGVLWYQGCSDAYPVLAERYGERFRALVCALRRDLGCAAPFLTVQIGKWLTDQADDMTYAIVREAQRRAALDMSGVTVVPSIDLALSDGIHNNSASNVALGERAALVALGSIYARGGYPSGAPNLISAAETDGRVAMRFANVMGWLQTVEPGGEASNFEIEDERGRVSFRDARCDARDTISLKLERPLCGAAFISLAAARYPKYISPADRASGIPALAFYRAPIEKQTERER